MQDKVREYLNDCEHQKELAEARYRYRVLEYAGLLESKKDYIEVTREEYEYYKATDNNLTKYSDWKYYVLKKLPVEMSEEEFLRSYEVNLFSVYRVNKTFLPLLKKGSRILITTSELAPLSPLPFTGIYGITKTALDAYAISLRRELMLLGIPVIIIRPGAVDTGLLDVSTRRLEDFCEHTEHYSYNADRFRKIVAKVESRKITPERLSELVEKALFASHPRLIYTINRNPLLLLMNILPAGLQDAALKWILLK